MERNLTVLLAEDDQDDIDLFVLVTTELINCEVDLTVVKDGEELIQLLNADHSWQPDLIVLDQNMPRKNGLETLDVLKNSCIWKDIPVVFFTTNASSDFKQTCFAAGAKGVYSKPHKLEEMAAIINRMFYDVTVIGGR